MSQEPAPRRLRVLESFKEPRSTSNPYVAMLLSALREQCDVECFTWRSALRGRYDVFHVHWPEVLLSGGRASRRPLRQLAFAALLTRLRWRRTTVVRTVHNLEPHEPQGVVDRQLLKQLDRLTDGWILLNADTPVPADACVAVVAHGHYRPWFRDVPAREPRAGSLLYFGQIRPYKGVPALITAFREIADPDVSLDVMGKPHDDAVRAQTEAAAAGDSRVVLNLRHVPDEELAVAIGDSSLVVLPYEEMHNSGALLLALSLERPVLVPANRVTQALAQEVGQEWIIRYQGPITARVLEDARTVAVELLAGESRPDLSQREWDTAALDHVRLFHSAQSVRGRRRG